MNFGDLKTYVQDVLGRTDIPNAGYVAAADDWTRRLRLQDDHATVVLSSPYTLPGDFLSPLEVRVDDTRLEVVTAFPDYVGSGTPCQFRISNGVLNLWPATTGDVTLIYAARPATLVNPGDTSAVLTRFEQVAIYGALYHISVMLRDAEGQQAFGVVYQQAIDQALREERRARFNGGQMIPVPRDAA